MKKMFVIISVMALFFTVAHQARGSDLQELKKYIHDFDASNNALFKQFDDIRRKMDIQQMKELVRQDPGVVTRQFSGGLTMLHIAAFHNDGAFIQFLISRGGDVNASLGDTNVTPLHIAAISGNPTTVEYLIRYGAVVNCKASDGSTPLYFTILRGFDRTASVLVEGGADINGRTISLGSSKEKIPLIIFALLLQRNNIAKLLVENGAQVNVSSNDGFTPLFLAAITGNVAMTRLLLLRGADPNGRSFKGFTPYDAAVAANQQECARLIRGYQSGGVVIPRSKNAGAVKKAPPPEQNTSEWVSSAQPDITQSRPEDTGISKEAAAAILFNAVERNDTETIRKVFWKYPDLKWAKDRQGNGPIHYAIKRYSARYCIDVLLQEGVSINGKNDSGYTPMDLARERGDASLVDYLMRQGGRFSRDVASSVVEPSASSQPSIPMYGRLCRTCNNNYLNICAKCKKSSFPDKYANVCLSDRDHCIGCGNSSFSSDSYAKICSRCAPYGTCVVCGSRTP